MNRHIYALGLFCAAWLGAPAHADINAYTVTTWNMQADDQNTGVKWPFYGTYLMLPPGGADILLVQNAGDLLRNTTPTGRLIPKAGKVTFTESRWNIPAVSKNQLWLYKADVNTANLQGNLSIVSLKRADIVITLPGVTPESSPIFGILLGNTAFFNVLARRDGKDAASTVNRIYSYFLHEAPVRQQRADWWIGGTFDLAPAELSRQLDLDPTLRSLVKIVHPDNSTTLSDRESDYFIVGNARSIPPEVTSVPSVLVNRMRGQQGSNHMPVGLLRQ